MGVRTRFEGVRCLAAVGLAISSLWLGLGGPAFGADKTPVTTAQVAPPAALKLLHDADDSIKRGDIRVALIQLKNAVRLAPKNGGIRAQLGLGLLRAGSARVANIELRKALADNAPEEVVVPAILQAMLVQGKAAELLAEFPDPQLKTQSKTAPDILMARAAAFQNLKRPEEAKVAADRALKLRRDVPMLAARAKLAAEQNDLALARRLTNEALKMAPGSENVEMLDVILTRQAGNSAKALLETEALARQSPRSLVAKVLRIELLLDLKRDADARVEVDALLKERPRFAPAIYYDAILAARANNPRGAWALAQNLQPEFVQLDPTITMAVAQMAVASGNLETGRAMLAVLVSRQPDVLPARIQLARIQMSVRDPDAALRTLEPIRASEDLDAQALLGQVYLQLRRYSDAITALEKATKLDPKESNGFLRWELARSALDYGDNERAVTELRRLSARDPRNWAIAAPLITALISSGRMDDALAVVDRIAMLGDKTPLPTFYRAQILAARGDLVGATAALGKALAGDPNFTPALYFRARVFISRGNFDAARQDFRKLLEHDPKDIPAYLGLAQIAANEDQETQASALLKQAITVSPKDPAPRSALANYQLQRGRYREAESTINALFLVSPNNVNGLLLKARLLLATGKRDSAVETFRAIAAKDPRSPAAYALLAQALHGINDRLAAIDAAKKTVELAPFSLRARSLLAEYQVAAERPDAAIATVQEFRATHPGPSADLLLADTFIGLNRLDEAKDVLQRSYKAKPDRMVALRLSQIAMRSGDAKGALQMLSDWLKSAPDDFEIRLQHASLLQTQDQKAARGEFETLLKQRPEDPILLNNLASILANNDRARALSLASLAARVGPQSAAILDTLGWLEFQNGDRKAALTHLQRAHDLSGNDGEIGYHLVLALQAAGSRAEAKSLLQSILSKDPHFDHVAQAKELLGRL